MDKGRQSFLCGNKTKRVTKLKDYSRAGLDQRHELFYWSFRWGTATRNNVNIRRAKEKEKNEFVKPSIPFLLSVKVLSLNVRSSKKHYADVEALLRCLESPPPRILCFCETWLANSHNNLLYLLPGYNGVISSSRINRR